MTRALSLLLVLLAAVAFAGPKKKPAPKKPPPPTPAYVSIAPVVDETKTPDGKNLADAALKSALSKWKPLTLAPPGEPEAAAKKAIAAKKAVGIELSLTLKSAKDAQLDAALVVATYPEHALRSEYRAGGGGGPVTDLIAPVIDQLVADLAKDQAWQPAP